MSLLIPEAEAYLDRYEAKTTAKGFEFTPPPEKAPLGQFAFPDDVFSTILTGVVTGILTRAVIHLVSWPFQKKDQPQTSVASMLTDIRNSTDVIQRGIEKLTDQGVKTDEAKVALDLLMEAIAEVLAEFSQKKPA